MSDTERASETRATARTISGILCSMFAAGLSMWGVLWIRWVTSGRGADALWSGPFIIAATVAQFTVAAAFAVTAVLYFLDSPHARRLLWISSIGLLLEMPLTLLAICELATLK
jgi:hypothetical protein